MVGKFLEDTWFTSLVDLCKIASRYVLDKVKDFRPFLYIT